MNHPIEPERAEDSERSIAPAIGYGPFEDCNLLRLLPPEMRQDWMSDLEFEVQHLPLPGSLLGMDGLMCAVPVFYPSTISQPPLKCSETPPSKSLFSTPS